MTRITRLDPEGHHRPVRPYYSQTVRVEAGAFVFVSGEAPLDEQGRLVGEGDAAEQARAILANLKTSLAAHGASLADLVNLDVYLADMADYDAVGRVREEAFPSAGPAGILVGGAQFPIPGMRVAMRGIAACP
jgi:enamine deaminase RidA (YjgF/YER057c/UK114 family)